MDAVETAHMILNPTKEAIARLDKLRDAAHEKKEWSWAGYWRDLRDQVKRELLLRGKKLR